MAEPTRWEMFTAFMVALVAILLSCTAAAVVIGAVGVSLEIMGFDPLSVLFGAAIGGSGAFVIWFGLAAGRRSS